MEIIRLSMLPILLIVPAMAPAQSAEPDSIPAIALEIPTLERETAHLRSELNQFIDQTDLDDSLGLAWADRPYRRATAAILQKTISVLAREIELRKSGNGAIDDRTIRSMIYWARDALTTIDKPAVRKNYHPDRYELENEENASGRIGLIDKATSTRWDPVWGDFEILMCTGLPVYAHGPSPWIADTTRTVMTLACREWNKTPIFFKSEDQDSRFHVIGFEHPLPQTQFSPRYYSQARARIWKESFETPGFLLIEGWRDLRDGSGSPYPSLFTNPQMLETICHTGLDMQFCVTQYPDLSPDTVMISTPGKNAKPASEQIRYWLLINTDAQPARFPIPEYWQNSSEPFTDILSNNTIQPDESNIPLDAYEIRLFRIAH